MVREDEAANNRLGGAAAEVMKARVGGRLACRRQPGGGGTAMRALVLAAIVGAVPLWASGQTSSATDAKVQAPELKAPERGSVAGQLSKTVFGPADVARGSYTLPAPLTAPTERGPLLASVFPTYTPEGGMSEWGLGWGTSLQVTRSRVVGNIDYGSGDELTGPWGRLVKGTDGAWYPAGLSKLVRVVWGGGDTITAYEPDGTQEIYGGTARVANGQGTYAWALTDVVTVTGRRTHLAWTANVSGRLYLSSVSYGGVGTDYQYRIDLAYEVLPQPFVDYRSRYASSLDRRVKTVTVYAKHASTGVYAERWHHELSYADEGLGPASYLTSVQQVFKGGEKQPAVTYAYNLAGPRLASAQLVRVPKVDGLLAALGADALQPGRSAQLDIDQDGLADLEHSKEYTLVRQTETGFEQQALGPMPANVYARCRKPASTMNAPRTLASMSGDDSIQVVDLALLGMGSTTGLTVCSRDGVKVVGQTLSGDWQLGANTRLVDVTGDHKPDLVRVTMGSYRVLVNVSAGTSYAFGTTSKTGTLTPTIVPDTSWVQDVNGDGLPDLVARTASSVVVWYGKGNGDFDGQGKVMPVKNTRGETLNTLTGYALTLVDANRDGLVDLLLTATSGNQASLFANTGSTFQLVAVPGLAAVDTSTSMPVVGDFSGSGNAEVSYTRQGQGWALTLEGPETGLLASADDGKGTVLWFEYGRASPYAKGRSRQAVLARLTVQSTGYGDVAYAYGYQRPYTHGQGKFLVGYGEVDRWDGDVGGGVPLSTSRTKFDNGDTYAALPLLTGLTDYYAPGLEKYTATDYEDAPFQGFAWKRRTSEEAGWRSTDPLKPGEVLEATYVTYEPGTVCPRTEEKERAAGTLVQTKRYAALPAFAQSLACIAESVVETGTHGAQGHPEYDFTYETAIAHNEVGEVTQVASVATTGERWVLQDVTYDAQYRIKTVSAPGRGTSAIAYVPATGLLSTVTGPTGVVVSGVEFDPVTDGLRQLRTDRGSLVYDQWLRYDGQERLAFGWDSIGSGTEYNPDFTYSYRYATSTMPASITGTTLVDTASMSVRTTMDLLAADGSAVGTAAQIPEGWALGRLSYRAPAAGALSTHTAATLPAGVDPGLLGLPVLFQGAEWVTDGHAGPLGGGDAIIRLHADVQEQVATTLGIDQGQLVKISTENGAYTQTRALDGSGYQTGFWNEVGTAWGFVYDALGRLREVRLPDGNRHRVDYDDHGQVARINREGVATIEYAYDSTTGLLAQKRFYGTTGLLQRTVSTTYDAAGRISRELHQDAASGDSRSFRYYHDGATPSSPSDRSQLGFLTGVSGKGFERVMAYRPDGKLTSRTLALAGGWRTLDTTVDFNEAAEPVRQVTTVRDPDGRVLVSTSRTESFDPFGRLLTSKVGAATVATYGYDADGLLARADLGGGGELALEYDGLTRAVVGASQRAGSTAAAVHRRMNARALVETDEIRVGELSLTREYQHSRERLLRSSVDARAHSEYEYTPSGVPATVLENGVAVQVRTRKDDLGRVIQRDDVTLSYGPDGQLSTASQGLMTWSFVHDEAGQRLVKYADGVPVAAYPDEGFLDATGLTEPVKLGGRSVGLLVNGVFEPRLTDLLGSVLADPSGAPRVASPYGSRWLDGHPARSGALDYVEKGFDADLGLVRMGLRDYDPELAAFTSPDPLFLEQPAQALRSPVESNLYSYVAGDPVGSADPTGLWADDPLPQVVVPASGGANYRAPARTEDRPLRSHAHSWEHDPNKSSFGMVRDGAGGPNTKPHQGLDLRALVGTRALAVDDGYVERVVGTNSGDYGRQVVIRFVYHYTAVNKAEDVAAGVPAWQRELKQSYDGKLLYAHYAHLDGIGPGIVKDAPVNAGQVLGRTGASGNAAGLNPGEEHLHFELREIAAPPGMSGLAHRLDPQFFMQRLNASPADNQSGRERDWR
jgi:RHS repeat-associated protein